MRQVIKGIRLYRDHPAKRSLPDAPAIWRAGTTTLRDYNPSAKNAPIILVIPSLINRYTILDLDKDLSFLRTLASQGFRPLLVDWDAPGETETGFTLDDYVLRRLIPTLELAAQWQSHDETCPAPCHVLGYCMGGLLAIALATLRPELVKTITLLATPWDFHQPDPKIGPKFLDIAHQVESMLNALGYLPVDMIQTLFASFQPLQVPIKFANFGKLDPTSGKARHFALLEDWLNDGVPLTAPVARACFRELYGCNLSGQSRWKIGGVTIEPRALDQPAYIVAPGKDRIVPPESTLPLANLLPNATLIEPMTGHIGIIASRSAPSLVWDPYIAWLQEHSAKQTEKVAKIAAG
ncbi:MAG: alpha/beta fold hydrolase [Bdellovibrionales bacterium]